MGMLVPKKNRSEVYKELFKEGVLCAKKDFIAPKHHSIESVPNLQVIKMMQSLKSRGYVTENFSWQWYYWYLTNEGIEYLREFLHLPADVVPNTLKKSTKPPTRPSGPGGDREKYERPPRREGGEGKKVGPGGDFNPEYRGENRGAAFGGERRGGFGGARGGRGGFGRGREQPAF
eukprot:TRINITY_DN1167_c0_g1::TRINITY_DN1167_c0_g1_i1::g.17283::m.17283 TRINITY_DN1167_c0_g1::TRINITY_DN1167_c0_g1_i1::g.17283  ORF type:complete len:194 (+),score=58.13,sp/Q962R9/RS10_SPOFR/50.00/3e-48,S10_plectin/PF03501.10/6.1e-44,Kinase-like/PF14531.1/0.15 TRINITY_DN1167_c0_g1_i1:59-583(+)